MAEERQQKLLDEEAELLARGAKAHKSMSYAMTGSTQTMSDYNAS